MNKLFEKYIGDVVSIFCVSILAIFARGYYFGVGDQVLHIPIISKLINAELYSTDYIFPLIYSHVSLPYYLVLFFAKLGISIAGSYFFLHAISSLLLFSGIYLLAHYLTSHRTTASIALLFFIYTFPIGGSATTIVETHFVPRVLATSLIPFILIFLYQSRYFVLYLLCGVVFLIHPLTGILIFGLCFGVGLLLEFPKHIRDAFIGLAIFILVGLPIFIRFFSFVQPQNNIASPMYESILRYRNSYAFPFTWQLRSWLFLVISLFPLTMFLYASNRNSQKKKQKIALLLLLFSTLALSIQIVFTEYIPLLPIIQLQLGRVWIVTIIISFIYAADFVRRLISIVLPSIHSIRVGSIVLLSVVIISKGFPIVHTQSNEWVNIQVWARHHTNSHCTFFVDFYSQGFRAYSQRSTIGEFKDGTLSFYSESFANEWWNRLQYFDPGIYGKYISDLYTIQESYPFSFAVLHNNLSFNGDIVYKNTQYSVYEMKNKEPLCEKI